MPLKPTPTYPPPPSTTTTTTYTTLLRSSTLTRSLLHGKQIHAHLLKSPLTLSLSLLNSLLNLYCKCADPKSAHKLFVKMPQRDTASYNQLIAGYSQMGLPSKAMHLFIDARNSSDTLLDDFTYASALRVCSQTADLHTGRMIHALIVVGGFSRRVFMTNSLIGMYSRCGRVEEARRVFGSAEELDVVSWNSLISANERGGSVEETLKVFAGMRRLGMGLNSFALGSVLKSCSSSDGSVGFGKMVHGCVVKVGLDSDVVVGSAMIDSYSKNGVLDGAVKFFKQMPNRNVVVFNAMIAGISRLEIESPNEVTREALSLFPELQMRGIKPTKFTFSSIIKACNVNEAFELGKQIHGHIFKANLQADEFIGSALIDLYSNSNSIEDGLRCFNSIPKLDIVTWTSMISGCIQNEQSEKALTLFRDLLAFGRRPDQATISSVMSACANLSMIRSGEQVQSYSVKSGFYKLTICGNAQIEMYARSGDIDGANRTFEEEEERDVVSWSASICGHAHHGCARDALRLFKEMEGWGIEPNQVTFIGVLTACSHGGLVDEGLRYYERMERDYGISPNVKHCACVVDLFGRAGRLAEAEDFILNSGFKDDPIIWRALLSSCRIHPDIARAQRVAARVMELDPHASASYVLLYNLFSDNGEKQLAFQARDLMKHRGVKKEPGLSWIQIGSSVHSFVAGDVTHPQNDAIYSKLGELISKIERLSDDSKRRSLMNCHSEQLAVALGMICLPEMAPIRVMKNLRTCEDCHEKMKAFSEIEKKEIVLRDPIRFHRFRGGSCSCRDYW